MEQKQGKPEDAVSAYTRQAIMIILHIMRNLRGADYESGMDVELSYPQIVALYALLESGTTTMSELAGWLKISHSVATRTADRLVAKGLVERWRSEEDRRVVKVRLSESGREFAERMISSHLDLMNEVFGGVPDGERAAFLDLLKEIDAKLEEKKD